MKEFDKVVSGEEIKGYETGAIRGESTGKGRYDLLPPYALKRIAKHYENGAVKYADRNWEKGISMSRYIDSALRHVFTYLEGNQEEDHMAAAVWNLLCYIETEKRVEDGIIPKEVNDMDFLKDLQYAKSNADDRAND